MTIQRCALKIRVGEMMEIIDRIRGQGIVNVVATDGIDGVINHDVECLYYALENLGYQISMTGPYAAVDRYHYAIRV
jgi:hypothetical protein